MTENSPECTTLCSYGILYCSSTEHCRRYRYRVKSHSINCLALKHIRSKEKENKTHTRPSTTVLCMYSPHLRTAEESLIRSDGRCSPRLQTVSPNYPSHKLVYLINPSCPILQLLLHRIATDTRVETHGVLYTLGTGQTPDARRRSVPNGSWSNRPRGSAYSRLV